MTTLITGNKGFIGTKLGSKISHIGIDLKDGLNLLSFDLPPADIVFHLASQISVVSSWLDPVNDMNNMRMMVRIVKEYPRARIIYTQSAAALNVNSPYGFSKWAAGEYLKKFHKNWVICILPNVYGGGTGVVDIFRRNKLVTIYGDGEAIRDFVHVDDIVSGLVKAREWPVGEYQMGSGKGTKIKSLAVGKKVIHEHERDEIRESVLKNTTPNWKPKIRIKDYMQQE